MSFTGVWALFLPQVKQSLYFNNSKTVADTSMEQSTVSIFSAEKRNDETKIGLEISGTAEQVWKTTIIVNDRIAYPSWFTTYRHNTTRNQSKLVLTSQHFFPQTPFVKTS